MGIFDPATGADVCAPIVAQLNRGLGLPERALSDRRLHLTGPDFTLADAYLFVIQRWASMTGVDLAPLPHPLAFAERPAATAALDAEERAEAA